VSRHQATVLGIASASLVIVVGGASFVVSRAETDRGQPYRIATGFKPLPAPFVMFRTLAPPRAHGRIAMAALASSDVRHLTPLRCARVAYAGGRGLCLVEEAEGVVVDHAAEVFDRSFRRVGRVALAGVPTRVRVSPDGQIGAITTYAEEESPAGERLAIESVLVDLNAGEVLADLRDFRLDVADKPALVGPLDFASVSFDRDRDRFFATLSTLAARWVIVGSIRDRRLQLLTPDFATEALSPDGSRLIVKQRLGDRGFWQLGVMDLSTLIVHTVNQNGRSVDDQVEWLDNDHLVYHDANDQGTGVWVVAADGLSEPRLLIPDAFSPVIVR
jgi:hypothetical protein